MPPIDYQSSILVPLLSGINSACLDMHVMNQQDGVLLEGLSFDSSFPILVLCVTTHAIFCDENAEIASYETLPFLL